MPLNSGSPEVFKAYWTLGRHPVLIPRPRPRGKFLILEWKVFKFPWKSATFSSGSKQTSSAVHTNMFRLHVPISLAGAVHRKTTVTTLSHLRSSLISSTTVRTKVAFGVSVRCLSVEPANRASQGTGPLDLSWSAASPETSELAETLASSEPTFRESVLQR